MSNSFRSELLSTPIEYLKGVGPVKAEVFKSELKVNKFNDLLNILPFRYVDRTVFNLIKDIKTDGQQVQLKVKLISKEKVGVKYKNRLSVMARDGSGFIELLWFQGAKWVEKNLSIGKDYIVYGKVNIFKGKRTIPHPELELLSEDNINSLKKYEPVYHSSEKLDNKGLGVKARRKIMANLMAKLNKEDITENLPPYLLEKLALCSRYDAYNWIHFPPTSHNLDLAKNRLKFEEFFFSQLFIFKNKANRKAKNKGYIFQSLGKSFNSFYHNSLEFELTNAQKRVLKEIRADTKSGIQMNRLLQGDVGSGKTVVALMSMLMAIDNGFQACMMAPTEILALQHYQSLTVMTEKIEVRIGFLSGSVKGKKRNSLLNALAEGEIDILVGTHALIEDHVVFKNLGMAITDEQHRFGVGQRAKLWKKGKDRYPHILVMTATPIPRTLAMTRYGDLDVSIIDELPPGRKDVKTIHKYDSARSSIYSFIENEVLKGRQVYVVYPLIEESETLELRNLMDGYERLLQRFPRPNFQISIVHGRMKNEDKEHEMQQFVKGNTHIMVATTVIEVGVNVPNASVMIIENAERFGLSQLHQLRGRVGRGAEQSYCILMSGNKVSKEAKERLRTMTSTNDGFKIAEADLLIRGPGDITGTQQSGVVEFQIANIVEDRKILQVARHFAEKIIDDDPELKKKLNSELKKYLSKINFKSRNWGQIS